MFTKHFNVAMLRADLSALVTRFGADHVASAPDGGTGCTYGVVRDGALVPVCIIGQWVSAYGLLGVLVTSTPDPLGYEQYNPDFEGACLIDNAMWHSLESVGFVVDFDAREYARDVQQAQDNGQTWGEALPYADAVHIWRGANKAAEALGEVRVTLPTRPTTTEFDARYVKNEHGGWDAAPTPEPTEALAAWEKELLYS